MTIIKEPDAKPQSRADNFVISFTFYQLFYIDLRKYVCTHIDGKLLAPQYVSQHFTWLLSKNNMPKIRFHDLRHSSASYLKSLGFDLKDMQVWLRHKDIQTTMNIYAHLE